MMTSPNPPSISVLIVNYHSGAYLAATLRSLAAQTMGEFEAIVVDNGSPDGSFELARQAVAEDGRFIFDPAPANLGFAAGNNRAAVKARAPWLAALNPDAEPEPGWLQALLEAARRHPDVAMFGSTQLDALDPTRLDGAGDRYFFTGVPWRGGFRWPASTPLAETEVFAPCAAAAMYRADAFFQVGGFDESFFCYVEDVDLGFRLRLAGHRCIQVVSAVVRHVGGASSGGESTVARYYGMRNLVWCFAKNMPTPLLWPLLLLHVATLFFLLIRATVRGDGAVTRRALRDAMAGLATVAAARAKVQGARKVSWWTIAKALTWAPNQYLRRAPVLTDLPPTPLWRRLARLLLPLGARRRLGHFLAMRRIRIGPTKVLPPGPVVVVGWLGSALGLGIVGRRMVTALRTCHIPNVAVDISGKLARRDFNANGSEADWSTVPPGGVVFIHVNGPELPTILAELPAAAYAGRYRIGVWHWELPDLPPNWVEHARLLHEVWTTSRFCAETLARALGCPVRLFPPFLEPSDATSTSRTSLGLSPHNFVCLTAFDMRSSLGRKNPIAAVEAFLAAFPRGDDAVLLIKVHSCDPAVPLYCELLDRIADRPDIRLIDKVLCDAEQAALIAAADVVLSLHRAEGFGLLLAEAMAAGKAVVATGWSGNMDFMNHGNSVPVPFRLVPTIDPQGVYRGISSQWAEPDVGAATAALLDLYRSPERRRRLGEAARQTILQLYGAQAFRSALVPIADRIAPPIA